MEKQAFHMQCNHKFKNEKKCKTPHIYEDQIKEAFIKAFNSLIEIEEKQQENKVRKDSIDTFIDRLKKQDTILTEFDEALWTSTIYKVVIENDITFYFRDGTKIKQEIV